MPELSMPTLVLLLVAVVVGGGTLLANVAQKKGLLLCFGGMLLFSSIAVGRDWRDNPIPTVWMALQTYRAEAYFALGITTTILLVVQVARQRGKPVSATGLVFFALCLYMALLRFVHGGPLDGIFSVTFAVATVLPLLALPRAVIDDTDDVVRMLRVCTATNYVWLGMCAVQFVVNPRNLTTGNSNRFLGLLSNPQHAATLMAFMMVIAVWLAVNDHARRFRLLYVAVAAVDAIVIAWTGSRTGMGMSLIGLCAVLYARAGRAILLLPVVAGFAFIAFKLLSGTVGVDSGLSRLASMENTRSNAWNTLIQASLNSPLIGVGTQGTERSENSWLYAFAAYGIGALALAIVVTIMALWEMFRLSVGRFSMPRHLRPHADLIIGVIMMYFAGAVFEGYMIARVGIPTTILCVFLGLCPIVRRYFTAVDDGDLDPDAPESESFGVEAIGERP